MSKKKTNLEEEQMATKTETSCERSSIKKRIALIIISTVQIVLLVIFLLSFLLLDEQPCILARVIISALLALSWAICLALDLTMQKKGNAVIDTIDIALWLYIFYTLCNLLTF